MSRRSVVRRMLRRPAPTEQGTGWSEYEAWLQARIAQRGSVQPPGPGVSISVLTPVYDPPPEIFRATLASVLGQTWPHWEWLIVDNASKDTSVRAMLDEAAQDVRVRVIRSPKNLGIVGGMRRCLEEATGEFIVPLDHDDVLVDDALEVVVRTLEANPNTRFLYSDEDVLARDRPIAPYFRPDWDPVLNLSTSYIFHLCAFRRDDAERLGVFSDRAAEYVQDWDTVFRFVADGAGLLHVPEVLYHWRAHEGSSTNRRDPTADSLRSQRHVLTQRLAAEPRPDLYELALFPLPRGLPELWLRRRRVEPPPLTLIAREPSVAADARFATICRATDYPFAAEHVIGISIEELQSLATELKDGLVAVVGHEIEPEGDEWPWEAHGLMELHRDAVLISARILNQDRLVVAGGEILAADGSAICPDLGRHEADPGPWALSLKQRSAGAVCGEFFVADTRFLKQALDDLPADAAPEHLGVWLGAAALAVGRRVAFSPLVAAVAGASFSGVWELSDDERRTFVHRYGQLFPAPTWYPEGLIRFGA